MGKLVAYRQHTRRLISCSDLPSLSGIGVVDAWSTGGTRRRRPLVYRNMTRLPLHRIFCGVFPQLLGCERQTWYAHPIQEALGLLTLGGLAVLRRKR